MSENGVTIVYDGDCPFCTSFVRMTRLRAAAGPVTLVDARQDIAMTARLEAEGYDLDEGMVVTMGGRTWHGGDAVHAIALMTSQSGLANRLLAGVFRHPRVAAAAYPALRACRNLALRVLRRRRFSERGM